MVARVAPPAIHTTDAVGAARPCCSRSCASGTSTEDAQSATAQRSGAATGCMATGRGQGCNAILSGREHDTQTPKSLRRGLPCCAWPPASDWREVRGQIAVCVANASMACNTCRGRQQCLGDGRGPPTARSLDAHAAALDLERDALRHLQLMLRDELLHFGTRCGATWALPVPEEARLADASSEGRRRVLRALHCCRTMCSHACYCEGTTFSS